MEDRYSYSRKSSGALWRSLRDGDFEEEDVWAVFKESKDSTFKVGQSIESLSIAVTRHLPSAARMIPRSLSAISDVGSCCSSSTTTHDETHGVKQQQSAHVNIPDWSKFSTKMGNGSWHGDDDDDDNNDDDEYHTKFPPHEIIAKRLARSQISSFSVFEGVGRKLKGRDLRKVRNDVLTKTETKVNAMEPETEPPSQSIQASV
ncbi:Actin cytoskeleton-regulatory complex protein end3, putative isoform 1 [Hibiscus syriacus]|uniref:Actin cytoskeleton-regulatory complex protein end3, putative isoform 1 n=1 Tax=Hibiscus syriacus TaxID=106335 RepID=A0A6A2XUH4_HIBSY|nr:Actin cytoskeleton-regulatory complex protein end3, putative isoform 1 [Hibiscus syriacus]